MLLDEYHKMSESFHTRVPSRVKDHIDTRALLPRHKFQSRPSRLNLGSLELIRVPKQLKEIVLRLQKKFNVLK